MAMLSLLKVKTEFEGLKLLLNRGLAFSLYQ